MKKRKLKRSVISSGKRFLASLTATTMLFSGIIATNMYYGYGDVVALASKDEDMYIQEKEDTIKSFNVTYESYDSYYGYKIKFNFSTTSGLKVSDKYHYNNFSVINGCRNFLDISFNNASLGTYTLSKTITASDVGIYISACYQHDIQDNYIDDDDYYTITTHYPVTADASDITKVITYSNKLYITTTYNTVGEKYSGDKNTSLTLNTPGTHTVYAVLVDSNDYVCDTTSAKVTITADSHTGITNLKNNNLTKATPGNAITSANVSATYTSKAGTKNTAVSASDIYVIPKALWENNKNASNANLAKSITIPTGTSGAYQYYIVVKDSDSSTGYWASGLQTVSCDYHTGFNMTNNNGKELTPGSQITSASVTATYTSKANTLNTAVSASDIYVISASDWESNKSASNSRLAKSLTVNSTSGSYAYYVVIKDSASSTGYWVSDKQTVQSDYHTGVVLKNNTDSNLALGEVIKTTDISGTYTSKNGTLNGAISADDIYVISASAWESDKRIGNPNLTKNLTVPDDADSTFRYYIVVKDSGATSGYWESEAQAVDLSQNATGFDENVWYKYKDDSTKIEWNYKLDGNGDIVGLYTSSAIGGIVDSGGTLNIPARVAGRTVIKLGGGSEDTPVIPASEKGWTSISFPSTVTTLNDYAFYGTTAQAKIVIPSHITAIGVKTFYNSKITDFKASEMNGTIGTYAFGKTEELANVTLKGGESGLTISSVAFADSSVSGVTIRGNVTINKKAFRNNTGLKILSIVGDVKIEEAAFIGCSQISSLEISGTTDIGSLAFSGLTSLKSLYISEGTVLHESSFNGLTALTKLETDVSLPARSFTDCGAIDTIILDSNVDKISYDWEGHTSSVANRSIYIRNKDTKIEYYNNGGTYYSALGSSGNVTAYILQGEDAGANVQPSENVLTLNGYTSWAHDDYSQYVKGTADKVTFKVIDNVDTQLKQDKIDDLKDFLQESVQTGIDAYYTGVILTTKDINKEKMTVTKMYGSEEGDPYRSSEFYVVRTEEFRAEAAKEGGVTEDAIKAYEPVKADASDLDSGSKTGTLSVTVVVFYDETVGDNVVRKYYSTPVSIRIEEYTSKSYIEQMYGSYDAIVERLADLENQIAELKKQLAEADVETIEQLTQELKEYKLAYAEVVKALEEFMSSNNGNKDDKYFGTVTDDETGTVIEVIYINGNPVSFEDTGKTDSEGNKIYKVSYDLNEDGEPEEIYIVVKSDGIHVVDEDGVPVLGADDKEIIFKDTLGALQRQFAARLAAIKAELTACEDGINKIKDALGNAGIVINPDLGIDDITQIVDAINKLTGDLAYAKDQVSDYQITLSTIYSKLTGETLTIDQLGNLSGTLNVIIGRIQVLQNSLTVAEATVTDLNAQLNSAESKVSQLQTELESTKGELEKAAAAINSAKNEKAELQKQYEAEIAAGNKEAAEKLQLQIKEKDSAIAELETTKTNLEQKEKDLNDAQDAVKQLQKQIEEKEQEISKLKKEIESLSNTADGYKMTVDKVNSIFGLSLKEGADIDAALREYVSAVTKDKATITAIQEVVHSANTGDALVEDVRKAVASSGSGNSDSGSVSDSYNKGYSDGYAAGSSSNSGGSDYSGSYDSGLASKIDELEEENESLSKRVSYLESENESLNDQVDDLSDENGNLNSRIDSLNGQIYALSEENRNLADNESESSAEVEAGEDTSDETAQVEIPSEEEYYNPGSENSTMPTVIDPNSNGSSDSDPSFVNPNDSSKNNIQASTGTTTSAKKSSAAMIILVGIVALAGIGIAGYAIFATPLGEKIPFIKKSGRDIDALLEEDDDDFEDDDEDNTDGDDAGVSESIHTASDTVGDDDDFSEFI